MSPIPLQLLTYSPLVLALPLCPMSTYLLRLHLDRIGMQRFEVVLPRVLRVVAAAADSAAHEADPQVRRAAALHAKE